MKLRRIYMLAYRQYARVQPSKPIALSDPPFQPGQRVEIVMIAEDEPLTNRVQELVNCFKPRKLCHRRRPLAKRISPRRLPLIESGDEMAKPARSVVSSCHRVGLHFAVKAIG